MNTTEAEKQVSDIERELHQHEDTARAYDHTAVAITLLARTLIAIHRVWWR